MRNDKRLKTQRLSVQAGSYYYADKDRLNPDLLSGDNRNES